MFFNFFHGHIQPPSAIFLVSIKLAKKKNSLGVLNLSVFRGRLFNKEIIEERIFHSCAISFCVLLQDNRI
jgi:hypothetical protein